MSRDLLEVALALPEISAHSGGVERCLQLIKYSRHANVAYTALLPRGGIADRRVADRLEALRVEGSVTIAPLGSADHRTGRAYDAVVAPSEFWTGPVARARAAGARGPAFAEFMQLPYLGTLDVLKTQGVQRPGLIDLVRLPLVSARVLRDSLPLSAFQLPACALSVRSASRLGPGRVLGLTEVVARNLRALGFPFEPFIPDCPVGVDADAIREAAVAPADPCYDAVYVGRFHSHKGFLDLPQTVAEMRRRSGRDLRVAVCGTPQFPRHLRAFHGLVRAYGVERNLVLLGWQSRDALYRTIVGSKVLLYPSYVDSFSLTVLESLCLGTPVAAYAIDALRLVWGDHAGIRLARVGDVGDLARVAGETLAGAGSGQTDPVLKDQSRRLLERYTWPRAALSERRFYDESLQGASA